MSALDRKLLRDLIHLRGQVIAITLVVVCGVAMVVTSRVGYESLEKSRASYYAEYRFADVFASLKRAPEHLARELAAVPGVEAVRTRIVFDVTLDVPGLLEPATGRLTSLPERHVPILNDVHIRRGRYLSPERRDEVLVSEAFAKANRLEIGDHIAAILNGRWTRLQIVGIALSPEYVYAIQSGSLFPDNRRFGIVWMSREAMGPAFDMDGAFNDVVLQLASEAHEPEVLAQLDRLLEPYGGLTAYGRGDHVSDRLLSDEIRQNKQMGRVLPMIFLGVAAFLLNVLLSRLIRTQRDQIGVLKAFGYSHMAVAVHYLKLALVALSAGALIGTGVGIWLGSKINRMYVEFYAFPVLEFVVNWRTIVAAVGVAGIAALVGALGAMRRAWAMPPAEAMRPESPASFRAAWWERFGLRSAASPALRIIIRNLTRHPARASLSVLGLAFAVAILVLGRYFVDAIEHLAAVQFRLVQRDDVTVVSHNPLPGRSRFEIGRLPGVMMSEPFRMVPVRLRFEHRTHKAALMGLQLGTELRHLVGSNLESVPLPPEGVVLTKKLAEMLAVGIGDTLTVEVLEAERPVRPVAVSATVDEMIGLSAYMSIDALHHLMREGETVSGALLKVDEARAAVLYRRLKELPAIGGVLIRAATLEGFEKTIAESMLIFTSVLVGFSCILAFAVVYNTARIALSERGRELASLRVLGFTHGEVTGMLLGEQAILVFLAIPMGLALGYGVCALMSSAYQWELFRMPLIVSTDTYVFALVTVLCAALCTGWVVRRRLQNLDLVEVLKTRE
jgi:putative ABC transport system permease protein